MPSLAPSLAPFLAPSPFLYLLYKSKIVKLMPTTDRTVVNEEFGIHEFDEFESPTSASAFAFASASHSRFNSLSSACFSILLCSASFFPAATFLGSFGFLVDAFAVFVADSGFVICSSSAGDIIFSWVSVDILLISNLINFKKF